MYWTCKCRGPYTIDKEEILNELKHIFENIREITKIVNIVKEDTMDKEQRQNTYRKFETVRVNGAAHAIAAPVRAIYRTANPPSAPPGKLQNQMNKWVVLVLAGASSFMATLDSSIVNIGL